MESVRGGAGGTRAGGRERRERTGPNIAEVDETRCPSTPAERPAAAGVPAGPRS